MRIMADVLILMVISPFGKVLYGSGNDGESGYEGVVYKNVIGTYLHGPLLPKNPEVCDWLLARALDREIWKWLICHH